jgi:hypothetical protein
MDRFQEINHYILVRSDIAKQRVDTSPKPNSSVVTATDRPYPAARTQKKSVVPARTRECSRKGDLVIAGTSAAQFLTAPWRARSIHRADSALLVHRDDCSSAAGPPRRLRIASHLTTTGIANDSDRSGLQSSCPGIVHALSRPARRAMRAAESAYLHS